MNKDNKLFKLPNASQVDLSNVCRLCAKTKNIFIHVFGEEGQRLGLLLKIHQCLQFQMNAGDILPAVVCNDCCKKLFDSFNFFKEASEVQVMLQSLCQKDKLIPSKIVNEIPSDLTRKCPSEMSHKRVSAIRVQLATSYSWHCTDCSAIMTNPKELQKHHELIHKQSVQYQCLQCSKIYTVYRKFSRHVRLHRNQDKYKCEDCLKGFSTKQALTVHKMSHSDVQPFMCKECGCSFRQAATLYNHQRAHASGRCVFTCSNCKKTMTSSQALERHLLSHNKEYNFICEICGKGFIRKRSLQNHVMAHSGECPFICQTCNKRFRTQQQLKTHIVVHTGERSYQCDVCGKQFNFRSSLVTHTRIHTGEKPYSCDFCNQQFRFKGVYVVHRRKHTGERPYLCEVCGCTFTSYDNHAKHVQRHHYKKTTRKRSQLHMNTSQTAKSSDSFCVPSTSGLDMSVEKNLVPFTLGSHFSTDTIAATSTTVNSIIMSPSKITV